MIFFVGEGRGCTKRNTLLLKLKENFNSILRLLVQEITHITQMTCITLLLQETVTLTFTTNMDNRILRYKTTNMDNRILRYKT